MAKPILFDTISREKFDTLSDEVKAKKNYQIKETDGSITKHIGNLEGGEGGLPAVTSDDNGSVLTVVEGEWDKAEAPSSNNDFVVTYTDNGGTITADKSCADIISAIEAGKNVIAKFTTSGLPDKYFQLMQYNNTANFKLVDYSILTTNIDGTKAIAFYISHANTGESDMVVSRSLELGTFN